MATHNHEIAEKFKELADLLEIEGANPFRVRAYRNAARMIQDLPQEVTDMIARGDDLTQLPGIGKDLAEKINILVTTGKFTILDEARKRVPTELAELTKIQGLGPKKVKALHEQLHIKSFKDVERAAKSHQIKQLAGFSDKTENMLLDAAHRYQVSEKRFLLADVQDVAEELVLYLKAISGVKKVELAGSFRRRKSTVGDLDILVVHQNGAQVIEKFSKFEKVSEIISQGEKRCAVRLESGLQVDLRVIPAVSFGAAMHYFTGSKSHNIALRKIAQNKNWKFNEYGVFEDGKQIAGKTENEVYKLFALPFIEPELRENSGELEAAKNKSLPKLITLEAICGDLHCHTNATDGKNTLEEMVQAAQDLGYEYMAITDHTQHLTVARGQDKKRLLAQIKKIDQLNKQLKNFRILKSAEVDILEDGSLDMCDEVLQQLDLTVCSIHYKFDLPEKDQTERILRAINHPNFTIFGHPTGRLINKREPIQFDVETVFRAIKEKNRILEINAQPRRMDLSVKHARLAKEMGIKIAISTDSHSTVQLKYMGYGVGQARRAWLEKDDVVNTLSLKKLLKLL